MYRLEYKEKAHWQDHSQVLNALPACKRLERLVLINGFIPNDRLESLDQFAKVMEHLVAFCFISPGIEKGAAVKLTPKLTSDAVHFHSAIPFSSCSLCLTLL